jgi:hypothetical protein
MLYEMFSSQTPAPGASSHWECCLRRDPTEPTTISVAQICVFSKLNGGRSPASGTPCRNVPSLSANQSADKDAASSGYSEAYLVMPTMVNTLVK